MFYKEIARPVRCLWLVFLSLFASQLSAQTSNGVWGDSEGNFYVMLISQEQDSAVMFETDLVTASVLSGSFDEASNSLSLASLDGQLLIEASIVDGNLTGSISEAGEQRVLDADLLLAYVGGASDGIWQSDLTEASYLAYLTVQLDQSSIGLMLDARFDDMGEVSLLIYSGPQPGDVFNGVRIDAPAQTLRVDFSDSETAVGTYRDSSSFPPSETGSFTAFRVF